MTWQQTIIIKMANHESKWVISSRISPKDNIISRADSDSVLITTKIKLFFYLPGYILVRWKHLEVQMAN